MCGLKVDYSLVMQAWGDRNMPFSTFGSDNFISWKFSDDILGDIGTMFV